MMTVLRGRAAVSHSGGGVRNSSRTVVSARCCKSDGERSRADRGSVCVLWTFPAPQLPALSTCRKTRKERGSLEREGNVVGAVEEKQQQSGSEMDGPCALRRFKCEFQVIFFMR